MRGRLRLEIAPIGQDCKVFYVDDDDRTVDISCLVTDFTVTARVGQPTRVRLGLLSVRGQSEELDDVVLELGRVN